MRGTLHLFARRDLIEIPPAMIFMSTVASIIRPSAEVGVDIGGLLNLIAEQSLLRACPPSSAGQIETRGIVKGIQ